MWWIAILGVFLSAAARPTKARIPKLDYVLLEVNKERQVVKAGESLSLVSGDQLKIIDAVSNTKRRARYVQLKGYSKDLKRKSLNTAPKDHRDIVIDTAKDLNLDPKLVGDERVYTIHAIQIKNKLKGVVQLKVKSPELRYALCSVNGKERIMRPGETLRVKRTDQFKLERFESNLGDAHRDVVFSIEKKDQEADKDGVSNFEIQFRRSGYVFARIPLEIEGY